jgi:molybdopterin converting factor small subunit
MSVKVEIPYYLRHYVGNREIIEVNGNTIKECLEEVVRQYPAIKDELFDGTGEPGVILLHQGEPVVDVTLGGKVKDGDVIGVYPVIVGG